MSKTPRKVKINAMAWVGYTVYFARGSALPNCYNSLYRILLHEEYFKYITVYVQYLFCSTYNAILFFEFDIAKRNRPSATTRVRISHGVPGDGTELFLVRTVFRLDGDIISFLREIFPGFQHKKTVSFLSPATVAKLILRSVSSHCIRTKSERKEIPLSRGASKV